MLTQFNVRTRHPLDNSVMQEFDLGFNDPVFQIQSITGLTPVDTTVNTDTNGVDPGVTVSSTQDGARNIVITLGFAHPPELLPDSVVSQRQQLNAVFTPGTNLEMDFCDDTLGVYRIYGIVEKNDPTMFDQNPSVQISIICENPYFMSMKRTVIPTNPTALLDTSTYAINTISVLPTLTTFDLTPYGIDLQPQSFEIDCNTTLPGGIGFFLQYTLTGVSNYEGHTVVNLRGVANSNMDSTTFIGPMVGTVNNENAVSSGTTIQYNSTRGSRTLNYMNTSDVVTPALFDLVGNLTSFNLFPGKNIFIFPVYATGGQSYTIGSLYASYTPLFDGM